MDELKAKLAIAENDNSILKMTLDKTLIELASLKAENERLKAVNEQLNAEQEAKYFVYEKELAEQKKLSEGIAKALNEIIEYHNNPIVANPYVKQIQLLKEYNKQK